MDDTTPDFRTSAGAADIAQRAADLAEHLPDGLKPLALGRVQLPLELAPGRRGRLPRDQPAPLGARRGQSRQVPLRPLAVDPRECRAGHCVEGERAATRCTGLVRARQAAEARPVAPGDRRLHVRRVRRPRVASHLLGRARGARRRHAQGGERPGASHGRSRAPLPPRLPPAAARHLGPAARVLGRERPEEPADGARLGRRRAAQALRGHLRAPDLVPGLARGRRTSAAPAHRLRGTGERPRAAVVHGASLRGRAASPPRPVRPPRDRRHPRPPSARASSQGSST